MKNKIYKNKDADLSIIQSKCIGIIGFGNQGRAQSLNLLDSKVDVYVGLRETSLNFNKVKSEGLKLKSIDDILMSCDIISILIPDDQIPELLNDYVIPNLKSKQTLIFSHGYSIIYYKNKFPKDIDIILIAPSGSGYSVRNEFLNGTGVPNLIAIHQDSTGDAKELALSYSCAIGGTQKGAFFSTFNEETETDLFGEQAVLIGGIKELIEASFNTLIDSGYSATTAWFVCYYEVKNIVETFHKIGFIKFMKLISENAEFGAYTKGSRIINKSELNKIIKEIKSKKFHRELLQNKDSTLKKYREIESKKLFNILTEEYLEILNE